MSYKYRNVHGLRERFRTRVKKKKKNRSPSKAGLAKKKLYTQLEILLTAGLLGLGLKGLIRTIDR